MQERHANRSYVRSVHCRSPLGDVKIAASCCVVLRVNSSEATETSSETVADTTKIYVYNPCIVNPLEVWEETNKLNNLKKTSVGIPVEIIELISGCFLKSINFLENVSWLTSHRSLTKGKLLPKLV